MQFQRRLLALLLCCAVAAWAYPFADVGLELEIHTVRHKNPADRVFLLGFKRIRLNACRKTVSYGTFFNS